MSTHTLCIISERRLLGGGVWCTRCPGYPLVSFTGLEYGKEYYQGFSGKKTSAENPASDDQSAVPSDFSDPCFCVSPTDNKTRKLFEVSNEVVHWKPVFFIPGKNKAADSFVSRLNILPQVLVY